LLEVGWYFGELQAAGTETGAFGVHNVSAI
jgi:hypothetical protein